MELTFTAEAHNQISADIAKAAVNSQVALNKQRKLYNEVFLPILEKHRDLLEAAKASIFFTTYCADLTINIPKDADLKYLDRLFESFLDDGRIRVEASSDNSVGRTYRFCAVEQSLDDDAFANARWQGACARLSIFAKVPGNGKCRVETLEPKRSEWPQYRVVCDVNGGGSVS